MKNNYDVYIQNKKIGQANIDKEGLYYRITCHINNTQPRYYRLNVSNGEMCFDLGLCVPEKNGFGLVTRVPIKRIGEGDLHFSVSMGKNSAENLFVPIRAEEPFEYIHRLENAYLDRKDGIYGVRFRD